MTSQKKLQIVNNTKHYSKNTVGIHYPKNRQVQKNNHATEMHIYLLYYI
jgi:hypothetical protein